MSDPFCKSLKPSLKPVEANSYSESACGGTQKRRGFRYDEDETQWVCRTSIFLNSLGLRGILLSGRLTRELNF